MEGNVRVRVTTVSGDETLHFAGSGTLTRDGRGMHLRYTARSDDGDLVSAAIHLGAGRALLIRDDVRLLLDPVRLTDAQIKAGGAVLPMRVRTHCISHEEKDGSETIRLHYTLSAAGQTLQELRLLVEWEPMRSEMP